MPKRSFGLIISISLILVTTIISFTSFHIFSHYLEKFINKEAENNIVSTIGLMRQQFYQVFEKHDGTVIKDIINDLKAEDRILNSYIFNSDGKLVYSSEGAGKETDSISARISGIDEDLYQESYTIGKRHFSRVYINMKNSPLCHECHSPELISLGMVVHDISINNADLDLFISKSSAIFTFAIIGIISLIIILLHYRFVRMSIYEFSSVINAVNNGDLGKRLVIPETKELGRLGKKFNNMLDTLQKAQAELQEFHKKELRSYYKLASIGEMAAKLAHQIRNPMTGISNAIEIIVKESEDEQNKPVLNEIQHQVKKVNDSVTSILKYSRKKELILEKNDVNDLISSLIPFLKRMTVRKKIQFYLDLQENIPLLRLDRIQMEDVLLNLGINAIQSIEEKGTVTFGTKFNYSDNLIYIYISDNGTGIPEENLLSIFHPFFTTKKEGTGLGLPIVKDIIDKHNGMISVENNRTGGCTFTIMLPVET